MINRTKFTKIFSVALTGLLLAFSAQVSAANAATILSVSYSSGDTALHIGSQITVNMTMLDVTNQLSNVSTSSPLTSSLGINSPDLSGVVGGTTVYVTDGTRSWAVLANGSSSVTIDDGKLINVGTGTNWAVANYISLSNQTFRVYLGALLNGLTNPAPTVTADLGGFGDVVLKDQGSIGGAQGDAQQYDGIWSGVFDVPDLGMIVTSSRIYGHVTYNGLVATNDAYQSPLAFDLDGLRPSLNTINFSVPSKPNYNNVLYLSASSQGTTSAAPTNTLGRFDVSVNKINTIVDITIETTPPRSLPSVVVPAGSQTLTGWTTWDGRDGNNNFAADAVYDCKVYIHDGNGVAGLTKTTQVRVTSMIFAIADVRLSPGGMTTAPAFTSGIITSVQSKIIAYRDNLGGLKNSLVALGWPAVDTVSNTPMVYAGPNILGSVYSLQEIQFLDQGGTRVFGIDPITTHDSEDYDFDQYYSSRFAADPRGFSGGDGSKSNDWEPIVLEELKLSGGTNADPISLTAQYGVNVIGASPSQGNYRLRLRAKLTGLSWAITTGGPHYFPDSNPEGASNNSGVGIYFEDSAIIFQVSDVSSPVQDNTPPVFLVSAPIEGSSVLPNAYGAPPSLKLSAQFQDVDSNMNASGTVSFIKVTDPQGGDVIGTSTTNGGGSNNTLTINFQPLIPLDKGGLYTMTVNTCNNAGLCVSKAIKFSVYDQTPPSVAAVELVRQTASNNVFLSVNQTSPEGPYQNISQVWVTLAVPSTSSNTIDWAASSVTLNQVVSGVRVPVLMDKLTVGTPTDGKLKYKITNTINYAGQFEVSTQTVSKDASDQRFYGPPAGTIQPQFTTQVCTICVSTLYNSPGNNSARPAITGLSTLTVTSGVSPVNVFSVGVDSPTSGLPVDTGWTQLSSALYASAMRFFVGGVLQTAPLTWTYASSEPLNFNLYYNDSDLPSSGVAESDLVIRAYSSGAWNTVSSVFHDSLPTTANAFTFSPVSSQPAAVYYAIKYPTIPGAAGPSTPTPVLFKSTRSFNPVHSNPIFRKARFYYSDKAPKDLEAKIYDTSGTLIKSLSLGSGVSLTDFTSDPTYGTNSYYFEWDGRNDNGTIVRNGIYLARWRLTRSDGSTETQVKPVALIK